VLNYYREQIDRSDILSKLGLEKDKYFLVSAHREENISSDKNFYGLLSSLNAIAEKYNYPIIVSTHPRTRKRLELIQSNPEAQVYLNPLIQWQKPMGFSDYNALQMNAKVVLSDSGTISEESSILNFRALNIRDAHERPEAMEEASVMMVGMNTDRILQGIAQLEFQQTGFDRNFREVLDYRMPNVSEKVVRIILSYSNYVQKVVWRSNNT
jgi:UDP-N-acetylglucosamine 2-epimerase